MKSLIFMPRHQQEQKVDISVQRLQALSFPSKTARKVTLSQLSGMIRNDIVYIIETQLLYYEWPQVCLYLSD